MTSQPLSISNPSPSQSVRRRDQILTAVIVVAAVAWYAFRPERSFLAVTVDEPAPFMAATVQVAPQTSTTTEPLTGQY
jgi:hypothetical protein